MANAIAKLYRTTTKYLDSLPVNNGNIIFVTDASTLCLDLNNERHYYRGIRIFTLDSERVNNEYNLQNGFYYVLETNVIWQYYNKRWIKLTSGKTETVDAHWFNNVSEFPDEGIEEDLYITDRGIYNYKKEKNKYNLIANANRWQTAK